MSFEIKEVKARKQLKEFISLPAKIHCNHANWVPPIYIDEWKYFNPKKNKAFFYSDAVLVLAYHDGNAVGRVMGIINHHYNDYQEEKNGRFSYLECKDDQKVAHALLEYVEKWAKAKGMEKIVGPIGFNDQDPEGYLIEGFEHEPTLATYYNFEYIIRLLENEGYTKEVDYVVYKLNIPKEMPEFYKKIYQRAVRKKHYQILEFSKRKQLKPYIRPIFRLMNECFENIYGFQPLDEEEMDDLAKRYLPILDPRFIKIVTRNSEVIAFNIAMPNLSEGIRKAKGRLFPFGVFKILREAKKTRQLDSLIGGIKEQDRGRGVDVMIGFKTIESAQKAGFEFVDSHHELETNLKVRAEMERLGGQVYKRFRIFQKKL